jgi:hypothetical protein
MSLIYFNLFAQYYYHRDNNSRLLAQIQFFKDYSWRFFVTSVFIIYITKEDTIIFVLFTLYNTIQSVSNFNIFHLNLNVSLSFNSIYLVSHFVDNMPSISSFIIGKDQLLYLSMVICSGIDAVYIYMKECLL